MDIERFEHPLLCRDEEAVYEPPSPRDKCTHGLDAFTIISHLSMRHYCNYIRAYLKGRQSHGEPCSKSQALYMHGDQLEGRVLSPLSSRWLLTSHGHTRHHY